MSYKTYMTLKKEKAVNKAMLLLEYAAVAIVVTVITYIIASMIITVWG